MRKGIFILILCAGILVYVIVAPFNPPIFHAILGASIIGELWCLEYLIRIHKKQKEE